MERQVALLSIRERKILELLAQGYSDAVISSMISVPESTVRKNIHNMLLKQGFVSHFQLINWAYREAIIS
ncbi:LuxR C-terminal-related transcriptional regulator [Pontibacter sp. H259]|uniref:response regulator transcription factor n=1 Tax=Pontibacter sp. H259 TaxID=3133421 RepID=UPI0030BFC77D